MMMGRITYPWIIVFGGVCKINNQTQIWNFGHKSFNGKMFSFGHFMAEYLEIVQKQKKIILISNNHYNNNDDYNNLIYFIYK